MPDERPIGVTLTTHELRLTPAQHVEMSSHYRDTGVLGDLSLVLEPRKLTGAGPDLQELGYLIGCDYDPETGLEVPAPTKRAMLRLAELIKQRVGPGRRR